MTWLPTGPKQFSRISGLTLPAREVGEVVTCNRPRQSSRFMPPKALSKTNTTVGGRKFSAVSNTHSKNRLSLFTRIQGVHLSSAESQNLMGGASLQILQEHRITCILTNTPLKTPAMSRGPRRGVKSRGGVSNKPPRRGNQRRKRGQARGRRALRVQHHNAELPTLG